MRLAHKISLLFLAVSFICLTVGLGSVYKSTERSLTEAIATNLQLSVRARAKHIETYLKMLQSSVVQASKSVVLPKALKTSPQDPGYQDALDNAAKLLKSKKDADNAIYEYLLLDMSGTIVTATNKESIGQDKSTDVIFSEGRKETYLKDAYRLAEKNLPLIAISSPLYDADGVTFLGVLVARVKLDDLDHIVEDNAGLGQTSETYIVNKSGYMITPGRFLKDAFLTQKIVLPSDDLAPFGSVDKRNNHVDVAPNYLGNLVLRAHVTVPQMKWSVVSEVDKKEALEPLKEMRRAFLLVFLLCNGMAWVLGQIIGRIILEPIRKLQQGAQIVGTGNLDHKVGINTKDEVGELSRAFDAMTMNLKNSTASIDSLNKEIVERQKTNELMDKQRLELDASLKESRKSREVLSSMLEDNNQIREKLERNFDELKLAQNMLVQSEKLASLGRLVSEIAHEVNNPLMIISGNAQLSLMSESLNEDVKKNLQLITEECQRAKVIIQRLLKFSRPSKGETKEVHINQSIEKVAAMVENQYNLANVAIKRNYLADPPPVTIDEQQMQEVFMNLLNNAKEAMPGGGSITITTSLEGDLLRIDFKDSGPGMSEDIIKSIFDPFFTTKEMGTGLGLPVCYGIVKAHNGEIKFESELNKGTTAIILLPLGGGRP